MLIELPSDAYELWVASFQPVLDRFAFVLVAEEQSSLVGFLAGRTRALPPHFGSGQAGFISDVFTDAAHRNRGIATEMLGRACSWFTDRGIERLELQVVAGNAEARSFYLRHGWVEELTQMVRETGPGTDRPK